PGYGTPGTQASNPANYVGWSTSPFRILNADDGDINQLYTAGTKIRQVTNSGGATWQGFFWDDTIAATLGWRRDSQTQQSGNAPISSITSAASMNYAVNSAVTEVTGDSTSWGVVVHEPKFLRNKLPWGT